MAGYVQSNQVILLHASNLTINAADTGKILVTPQTAGAIDFTYILPSPQAGLHYHFVNGAALALNGNVHIETPALVNIIYGSTITGPTGGVALEAVNGNSTVTFTSVVLGVGGSLRGDYIDLTCDGTNWYVDARSRVAQGIAIA